MRNLLVILLTLFLMGCEKEELYETFDKNVKLPTPINKLDLLVGDTDGAPIQKFFDFKSEFYSQVHYNNLTTADLVKMNFDGSYFEYNFTDRILGGARDSINGLTFDIDNNKTKILLNFWGEGEWGSWYKPNLLALYDIQTDTHKIILDNSNTNESTFYTQKLFDLNGDGTLDIFLAENGYYLVENDNLEYKEHNSGPGPVFIFDIDTDGIDDLIHYDTTNGGTWYKFKGGTNINKSTMTSTYTLKHYVDDYQVTDFDNDGDDDLIILDYIETTSNEVGNLSILRNDNGTLVDVTSSVIDNPSIENIHGDNNILLSDYDSDGDYDIFLPTYYYADNILYNTFYWENIDGVFKRIKRKDLK